MFTRVPEAKVLILLAAAGAAAAVLAVSAPAGTIPALGRKLQVPAARAGAVADAPDLRAPLRLSETGLYAGDGSVDPRNLPFSPQYPLWSDGAVKSRWVHLPQGATIDAGTLDLWRFPAGTRFWKEFAVNGRRIETRMIWKADAETWIFAAYVWTEDQTDALLAPEAGIPGLVEIAPGKRHSIPGLGDCDSCHRSSPSTVLGFNALQLSDDRDPLAPHAEPLRPGMITLRSLLEAGRLDPPRPDLLLHPPRIRESDPVARAALGYLSANCGGCHNGSGPLARLGLVLSHDTPGDAGAPEPAYLTAVGAPGRYPVPGVPADSSRVVAPGAPERSSLLYRMASRRPSSQMPPLGTVVVDEEAVRLVRRWIAGLAPGSSPGRKPA